jgi:hypothetical protein
MSGLESDTIGGYNALLEKQKQASGECVITTVLFDDQYELLHDRINLKGVVPITDKEYYVRGTTALLDAVGRTINKIGNAQKHTAEEERAEKVLFVITTDGYENASREYDYDKVNLMISHQKIKFGWEFIFLGANIDAVATAGRLGISADRSANYKADGIGTRLNYEVLSDTVCQMRASRPVDTDWKKRIDEDFKRMPGRKDKK